jgi:hypothetical protein
MRHITFRWIPALLLGLLVAGLATATSPQATRLGMVYDEDPQLPGTLDSVGRQLAGGDLLKTLDRGALVRLDNGRVLKFSPNTSARVERGVDDDVTITVLSGRVGMVDEAGRTLLAGPRSVFTLSPTLEDADAAERSLLAVDLEQTARRERPTEPRGRTAIRGR